jgi:Antitoxin VbhA
MTPTSLSQKEIERNMRSVAHAIAQQELEGLKVSDATIEDMQRAAQGEIRADDVIRNIHARLKHAQILRQ